MAQPDLPALLAAIDELLDSGDLTAASRDLDALGTEPEVEVLRIKLALFDGTLPPPMAMQKLIQLMRTDANVARGKELYQEASKRSYQDRVSSVSHSHFPPPVRSDEGDDRD